MSKVYLDKLLEIAKAEVGYLEKASNAQLDDKTANAGSANYTKYARDLYNAGYYGGKNKNGYAWCDMFVDWCFYMAAGKDAVHAQAVECQTGEYGAGCTFSSRYYGYQNRFYKSGPKVGDQIFFGTADNVTHTGLVYKVDSSCVYTIEGNTGAGNDVVIANGGAVAYKSYLLTNSKIYGYGRPKYDGEVTPAAPVVPAEPLPTKFVDVPAGTYYTEAVKWAVENGITSGVDETHFSPDKPCTRAQVVTFLYRLYQLLQG